MTTGNGCAHPEMTTDFAIGKVVCTTCGEEMGTVTTGTLGPDGEVIPDEPDQ